MKYWLHWILTVGIIMASTACTLSLAMHPEFALWFMALAAGLYIVARTLHREDSSDMASRPSRTAVAHT
ncbi:hypothetical protein [Haloarchaeobius salinus]|uniref:hypothetical protein n=1 Tax=Haloarchaeobius salinus TaxID=1198298 RepID=UPI0021088C46|nr:hypothetical protein [Haloarchaeobius salinus]